MNKLTNKFNRNAKSGQLNKTELIIILVHPAIGLLIWYTYQHELLGSELLRNFTSSYLFVLPLLLIGLFFRELRKIRFYLVWLAISIFQTLIYPMVKDNPDFMFTRKTSFEGLLALLPTLIMFQLLRQIFLSLKGQEMIISIRHYRMTMYEEEDRRNMTWLDVAFSIILMATAVFSGAAADSLR